VSCEIIGQNTGGVRGSTSWGSFSSQSIEEGIGWARQFMCSVDNFLWRKFVPVV